jgi:hypothetical protein
LIGVLGDRDANVFFSSLDAVEQAKLNTSGVLGKDRKVDAVPHPCRAQRIWVAEESPYRGHNAPRIYPASSPHWQSPTGCARYIRANVAFVGESLTSPM